MTQSIAKKNFILKTFSDDAQTKCQIQQTHLSCDEPQLRSFGVFAAEKLTRAGTQLVLSGRHAVLLKNDQEDKYKSYLDRNHASIVVDIFNADASFTAQALIEQLFFSSLSQALQAIPPQFAALVPAPLSSKGLDPTIQRSSGVFIYDGEWKEVPRENSKFENPKVVRQINPDFSAEARSAKFAGSTLFAFVVDQRGKTTDLWLTRPAGYGLDDEGAKALRQYIFKPALLKKQSVGTSLVIRIDWNTF